MNGKKKDVLIEDVKHTDTRTGVESVSDRTFVVWADAGMKDVINAIDGVVAVYSNQPYETKYDVYVDPRYDFEFIKREVEAAILCGK
jgi:hypothetical protein